MPPQYVILTVVAISGGSAEPSKISYNHQFSYNKGRTQQDLFLKIIELVCKLSEKYIVHNITGVIRIWILLLNYLDVKIDVHKCLMVNCFLLLSKFFVYALLWIKSS